MTTFVSISARSCFQESCRRGHENILKHQLVPVGAFKQRDPSVPESNFSTFCKKLEFNLKGSITVRLLL
jgi:hypothetical protein